MAEIADNLRALAEQWAGARAGERANLQLYVIELCDALLVARPRPRGAGYEFELTVDAISVEGKEASNFIDCWKANHFALEGKDDEREHQGRASNEALLRRAYGQVRNYVHHVPGAVPPPYLMVLDVAKTLIVWDRWAGTYGGFEAGRRIDLATLPERPDDVALLRDVWQDPAARDRRGKAQAVTVEIAEGLGALARALEGRGHDPEAVAQFLMRVVFSCFAEDVGLLPEGEFRATVREAGLNGSPEEFCEAVESLWRLMNEGGRVGRMKVLKFNGHFFRGAKALPLTREELELLHAAAEKHWGDVEPAIFGTLLTRALDPKERRRLGAAYTPPEYIERVIRPAIEQPVRERWTAVEAEVLQLTERARADERAAAARGPRTKQGAVAKARATKALATAEKRLRAFHRWLRDIRVLDPACGSGNFLYVSMHALKRVELEVLRALEAVTGGHQDLRLEEVGPWQFHGIEVDRRARELAELTLWIGYHQWWKQHHNVLPSEPVLRDTGTLDRRDAVLRWARLERAPSRDRPDPEKTLRDPATGRMVPDPSKRLEYMRHVDPKPAAPWPAATFIVGNPPYHGKQTKRRELGDGYVDALHVAYPDVAPAADYVALWWHRAAAEVAAGRTLRAGLITTNKLTQPQSRGVIEAAAAHGAHVVWAIADHPWPDGPGGAAVRVAMTVLARDASPAPAGGVTLVNVDREGRPVGERRGPRFNADLSIGADVAAARKRPLRANRGLATVGYKLYGDGFVLSDERARRFLAQDPHHAEVLFPILTCDDLNGKRRGAWLLDFGTRSEADADARYPLLLQYAKDHVWRDRQANNNPDIKARWWQLGHLRPSLRRALVGLRRYIVTGETSKHRFFQFLPTTTAPEGSLICIASDDAAVLGVLSSASHLAWAAASSGRMGQGNDPRYAKGSFDPFPFPDWSGPCGAAARPRVADLAERLDAHRARVLAGDAAATMTEQYNLLAKLRAGVVLTPEEAAHHAHWGTGLLRDLHEQVDAKVAAAYGWAWPLEPGELLDRLVALQAERFEAEQQGAILWLRPGYQAGAQADVAEDEDDGEEGAGESASQLSVELENGTRAPGAGASGAGDRDAEAREADPRAAWPADVIGQITVLRALAAERPVSVDEAARSFQRARKDLVARHLETLALLGEVLQDAEGRYQLAAGALALA